MPLIRPKKRLFQIGFKQIKKFVPKGDIIAPIYQKSFRIVFIGAIYVFLVGHCHTWNKGQ